MFKQHLKKEHGGNIWAAAPQLGIKLDELMDFSANINPLGPTRGALRAIIDNLELIQHYPEPQGQSCKRALSYYLKVNSENLVLGNGGSELIYLLGRMFYRSRILLLAPGFSEYGEGLIDPRIHYIKLDKSNQFKLPFEELAKAMQKDDLIFIGNPNNPTGNLFQRQELLELVRLGSALGVVFVVDEAFMDFTGETGYSLRDWVEKEKNLVVVSSLTKFFALPGLRLGYAVANKTSIVLMEQLLPPWRINTPALLAAEASLQDADYIQETIKAVRREREFLQGGFSKIKELKVYPGSSNFMLLEIETGRITTAVLQEKLGAWGILIRNCDNFVNLSPYFFRVAVRSHQENTRLLAAIRSVFCEDNSNQARGDRLES